MADQPARREMHLTPFGEARFVHLNRPDDYEGKKRYKTQLLFDGQDRDELQAKIDKEIEEFKAAKIADLEASKNPKDKALAKAGLGEMPPYEPELDRETGEETGRTAFKFGMNETIELKSGEVITRKPLIVDSKRRPIQDPPLIYSGSTLRVAYTIRPFYNAAAKSVGASLDLHKAQIKELATRSNRADNTFGEVEDGWTGEDDIFEDKAAAPPVSDDEIPF